jgi:hypothetical protein
MNLPYKKKFFANSILFFVMTFFPIGVKIQAAFPRIATMKYYNLYRITTYLLIFFCLTHTFGGLISTARRGKEADDVLSSMNNSVFRDRDLGIDKCLVGRCVF